MTQAADFESLVRRALTPVEPPEELAHRLEDTLLELTELAADELESWELSAMRDPRNWARPMAAAIGGATAATALFVVRAQRRRHARRPPPQRFLQAVERAMREAANDALRAVTRER